MTLSFGTMLKPFFKISPESFQRVVTSRYGVQEDIDQSWEGFEAVARTLADSFTLALDDWHPEALVPKLDAVDMELRGIAYEGAGMGLMILDSLGPWAKRFDALVQGPGARYICLLYIGAGLVLPRLPKRPERFMECLDPLYRWMVIDGYGFHEGFFSGQRTFEQQVIPSRLRGYARRAFDHGVGRSLWFATGANVDRISECINSFPERRQADLWGGIGLACAYAAGVVDREAIEALQEAAGPHNPHIAVGAAIAATFRQQAGNSAPHTELACEVLWGRSGSTVAQMAESIRKNLPADSAQEPAYDVWRQRIAERFGERVESQYEREGARQ
jgi:hypothetical protein